MRQFPNESRLDIAARSSSKDIRIRYAARVLDILLDLYFSNYVHGDARASNFYLYDGDLYLTDFETSRRRQAVVPFLESFDVCGREDVGVMDGLAGAFSPDPVSVGSVLGVSLDAAVGSLLGELRVKLRNEGGGQAASSIHTRIHALHATGADFRRGDLPQRPSAALCER